jgi:hypothetical protein
VSAAFLEKIDWSQPWLAHFLHVAGLDVREADWGVGLNAAAAARGLKNHRSLPLKFVPQADLPSGQAYEAFISETGGVPTRDNLHDFFNALVWLTYPHIKVRLNALQAAEIARRSASPQVVRGKLRDAATIFDENAVLLLASDPALCEALRRHQWHKIFVEQREEFEKRCEVQVFGHALMEKLMSPYKAITGHTWIVLVHADILALPEKDRRQWVDASVADQLRNGLSTSDFTHLPVLGVPGWWPGQEESFYADQTVFRAAKQQPDPESTERNNQRS